MRAYRVWHKKTSVTKGKIFFCAFLFIMTAALSVLSAPNTNANEVLLENTWLPVDSASPGTEPLLAVEQQGRIEVEPTITFSFGGTWVRQLEIDHEQFQQLSVPGCGATGEIGQPQMPFKGTFVEIPYGVEVDVQILYQDTVSLGTGYLIYPVQEPLPDLSDAEGAPFAIDREAYEGDGHFPESPVEVEPPAFIREKRVVFVKIFPMTYIPATGELIAHEDLSFRLIWRGEFDPNETLEKQRLRSQFFNPLPEELLANPTQNQLSTGEISATVGNEKKGRTENEPFTTPDEIGAVYDSAAGGISSQVINNTGDRAENEPFTTPGEINVASSSETSSTLIELSTTNAADYLIIVYDNFYDEILPLANWKNRMGYMTRVVSMSTVGTTYTDVKNYIQNAYDTWNPAPSFVLLVGDYNQVPSHNAGIWHPYYGTSNWPTDHIYACTSGSDIFPDLAIGRLSVGTDAECTTVVNKILEYDRTPDTGTWWDDALIAALFQDRDDPPYSYKDGTADRWFMETATHILDYLDGSIGYDIETAQCTDYWPLEYSTFHYRVSDYPHRPTPPDPVPTAVVNRWTSQSDATTDITTAINGGVGMVLHRDHGAYTGWGEPPYSVSNVNSLTNGDMMPVVYSMNCETGGFDYSGGDCFAEAFQKNSNGGASGVVAATRVSYSGYNDLMARGIIDSFWDDYDTSYSDNTYPNSWRIAEALNYGKYYMYTYEGSGDTTTIEFYLFHYFGDPSMMMRTADPQTLGVSHAPIISQSATSFALNVAEYGALVALEQDGKVLGTATSSGGFATVSISGSLSTSTVYVTVTKHDYLPYEGTVTIGGEPQSKVALFMDSNPWGFDLAGYIIAQGIDCTVYNSSDMGVVDLSPYDKVITASVQGNTFWNALEANKAWFEAYAASGGVLEMHLCAQSGTGAEGKEYPGGFVFAYSPFDEVSINDTEHPVVNKPNTITDADFDEWYWSAHGWFTQNPPAEVLYNPANNEPVFAEDVAYRSGAIFATTQTVEWRALNGYPQFLDNMLNYKISPPTCCPICEDFDDGVADRWKTDGSGTWGVSSGVYRMTGNNPATSTVRYTYYDCPSTDFTYEAKVRKTSGSTTSCMGIYFRADSTFDSNGYIFHISASGDYTYYKHVNGVLHWLAGTWIPHAAINTGLNTWNTLKVVANGNTFELYCNNALLTTFTDSTHSSGKAGIESLDTNYASDVVEFDDVILTCCCCNPFKENFDDGVADDWLTDGSGKWATGSGVYEATGTAGGSAYLFSHYRWGSADFVYKARLRMMSGDSGRAYGIRFRSDGTNQNMYGFNVSNTGYYLFFKAVGGSYYFLTSWTSSPAVNAGFGVWNTLKVKARGNSFTLYCNGTKLGTWTDSSFTAGKPGLSAYEGSTVSIVEFDDIGLTCGGVLTPILELLLLH